MKIYSSLWNADDWATRGGSVKTDWTKAPFTAYYRNFNVIPCNNCGSKWSSSSSSSSSSSDAQWEVKDEIDATGRRRLRWVQKYFMIYNYCTDLKRFPQGFPSECRQRQMKFMSGILPMALNNIICFVINHILTFFLYCYVCLFDHLIQCGCKLYSR